MPGLVQLQKEHPKDLQVIGWHVGKGTPEEALAVITKQNLPYPVVLTPGFDALQTWGGQHPPAVALVDKKGNIRYEGLNPKEGEEKALELLKE